MTNPNPAIAEDELEAQINELVGKAVLKNDKNYAWEILELVKKRVREARIDELESLVFELDEQDPYTPLDGSPRQYVHGKVYKRIATLQQEAESGEGS